MGRHLARYPPSTQTCLNLGVHPTLYRWLASNKYCVKPESCTSFKLFSYGPLFAEVKPDGSEPEDKAEARKELMRRHKPLRDVVGALEKALADTLRGRGV